MELWQLGLLTLIGIVAGWLNVMAGGGSLLTVPVMLFMGIPGPVANGTNRIAILAQNVSAVDDLSGGKWLSPTSGSAFQPVGLAAAVGARRRRHPSGFRLEGEWFDRVLALVMIAVIDPDGDRPRQG